MRYLESISVLKNKLIIGAAFYGRIFDVEEDSMDGLYQKGKFNKAISYKDFNKDSTHNEGFISYWDDTAKAPYMFPLLKNN